MCVDMSLLYRLATLPHPACPDDPGCVLMEEFSECLHVVRVPGALPLIEDGADLALITVRRAAYDSRRGACASRLEAMKSMATNSGVRIIDVSSRGAASHAT